MKRSACVIAFAGLGLVGCTAANPDYVPPGGDGGLGGNHDAAMKQVDLKQPPVEPDLKPPPECQPGDRSCLGGSAVSESCINGVYQPDRVCPISSDCMDGYCQVPGDNGTTQGDQCDSESQCAASQQTFDYSCQPFVTDPQNGTVEFHCAHLFGMGGSGAPCMSGMDCRSGYCIAGRNTCFRACNGDQDCPFRNGQRTVCRTVTITVEGVDVMATSCVNP